MKIWQTSERGQPILTQLRRLQLRRWLLLACLQLLRSISRWLQSAYQGPSSTQPLSGMSQRQEPYPPSRLPPSGSMRFYRGEPPQYRGKGSFRSDSPRSLNELSQAQLELALSVVHRQLSSHPLVAIWEPPEELSYLPQSEWICLIEVWEQLQRQRRHNPLH